MPYISVFLNYSSGFKSLYFSRDLRESEKTKYLENVKSHCNYRLVLPERNLVTKEDCEQVEGFKV